MADTITSLRKQLADAAKAARDAQEAAERAAEILTKERDAAQAQLAEANQRAQTAATRALISAADAVAHDLVISLHPGYPVHPYVERWLRDRAKALKPGRSDDERNGQPDA